MKFRNLIVLSIIATVVSISACRDDFDFDIASESLRFSQDTLNLDTIFNHTNSQTYKLTIHNKENKDIEIPRIYLSKGESSFFKMNVDGMPGFDFENVAVRKRDSILIFVEIAAGEAPINPLYEDEINFEISTGSQQIKLLSYIEKAKFYNTEMDENYQLSESTWSNDYSRVIFGTVNANNLTIGPKTKVYFHDAANLTVNGQLNVQGSLNNEVIFRTDRMDERSDSLPNMWGKIKIKSPNTSLVNSIDYAVIKGGSVGLEVDQSRLEIKNTKILNNERIGLYGINAILRGENMVINNSNIASLAIEGGDVQFIHSTFGNFFNIGTGAGGNYSMYLSNVGENNVSIPLTQANFYNCIFYGRASNALIFEQGSTTFNHNFKNNIIRLDFPNEISGIDNSNKNEDPMFVNSGFGKNDLRLVLESPAAGWGDPTYSTWVPFDILNQSRTGSAPTPGAYQNLVNPEDLN